MVREDIMLSELSQSQKDKYCFDPTYMRYLEQSNSQTQSRMVVAGAKGRAECERHYSSRLK